MPETYQISQTEHRSFDRRNNTANQKECTYPRRSLTMLEVDNYVPVGHGPGMGGGLVEYPQYNVQHAMSHSMAHANPGPNQWYPVVPPVTRAENSKHPGGVNSWTPNASSGKKHTEEIQPILLDKEDDIDLPPVSPLQRERFSYTRYQLELLNGIYTSVRYPNSMQKQLIAKRVGITRDQVKIWFQNRRRKDVIGQTKQKDSNAEEIREEPNKAMTMVPESVMNGIISELEKYSGENGKYKKTRTKLVGKNTQQNMPQNKSSITPQANLRPNPSSAYRSPSPHASSINGSPDSGVVETMGTSFKPTKHPPANKPVTSPSSAEQSGSEVDGNRRTANAENSHGNTGLVPTSLELDMANPPNKVAPFSTDLHDSGLAAAMAFRYVPPSIHIPQPSYSSGFLLPNTQSSLHSGNVQLPGYVQPPQNRVSSLSNLNMKSPAPCATVTPNSTSAFTKISQSNKVPMNYYPGSNENTSLPGFTIAQQNKHISHSDFYTSYSSGFIPPNKVAPPSEPINADLLLDTTRPITSTPLTVHIPSAQLYGAAPPVEQNEGGGKVTNQRHLQKGTTPYSFKNSQEERIFDQQTMYSRDERANGTNMPYTNNALSQSHHTLDAQPENVTTLLFPNRNCSSSRLENENDSGIFMTSAEINGHKNLNLDRVFPFPLVAEPPMMLSSVPHHQGPQGIPLKHARIGYRDPYQPLLISSFNNPYYGYENANFNGWSTSPDCKTYTHL